MHDVLQTDTNILNDGLNDEWLDFDLSEHKEDQEEEYKVGYKEPIYNYSSHNEFTGSNEIFNWLWTQSKVK
jgi:hypothetical protein